MSYATLGPNEAVLPALAARMTVCECVKCATRRRHPGYDVCVTCKRPMSAAEMCFECLRPYACSHCCGCTVRR